MSELKDFRWVSREEFMKSAEEHLNELSKQLQELQVKTHKAMQYIHMGRLHYRYNKQHGRPPTQDELESLFETSDENI